MLPHVDHANPERIPLEACIETLRGRLEAISRIQGGHTHYQEELRIFNEVANEQGWFLPSAPAELSLPPSDEGNEHQVWFREAHGTFLKATWPGSYAQAEFSEISFCFLPRSTRWQRPRWGLHLQPISII